MNTKENNPQTWESILKRMPELLETLKSCKLLRGQLPQVPDRGIYVFYHGGKPIYVGRTDRMRKRLQEHGRPSSTHNSATLAFAMALRTAALKLDSTGDLAREELQRVPKFKELFDKKKALVRGMSIRVVEITDPIEQAVFEIYAALELKTTRQDGGYNNFENH